MDNSVYITLSRQTALFRDMAVTANNLANVNSTGFQSEHMMFSSYLVQDNGRGKMAFAHDISTYRNTEQGTLSVTHGPLDVAINGDGYFVVETPLGNRYTRAGSFRLNEEGIIVNADGYPVLDANNQRIAILQDDKEITIGGIGNISVDGEDRATLQVVSFENPQNLLQAGYGLFMTEDVPQPAAGASVVQGAIEHSNVNPVTEVTHMIDVTRAVGSTAKFIEVMYDLQRKTTTTWTQQS